MKMSDKEIISEIDFYPVEPKRGLLCFASFTYQNALRVKDCAIVTRPNGDLRVSFPIKKLQNASTINVVHPISKEIETYISSKILTAYKKFITERTR